ncbi:MAG TPA: hypothetical protein VFU50_11935 [Terriglobales bacterium]|nr:hypothetical protein [Terriglobales bacterium]
MNKVTLFAALTKVDEPQREVWGLATAEVVDKDGEIFDYASSKPYFEEWSREIANATSGRSLGNVREMHRSSAVGKLVNLEFNDEKKTIAVRARIVDDVAWLKCVEGVYTGFSIGGRYVQMWPDGEFLRFTAQPAEISVVDNPAVPNAHFTAIKDDGSVEVRKFAASGSWPLASGQPAVFPEASSQKPAAHRNGDAMNPNYEQELAKAISQTTASLEKIGELDRKLESLESGLKELAEAFRKFSEGFAKSFTAPERRVARTSVTISKEDDARSASKASIPAKGEGAHGDAEAGFLEAMKSAHTHPAIGA